MPRAVFERGPRLPSPGISAFAPEFLEQRLCRGDGAFEFGNLADGPVGGEGLCAGGSKKKIALRGLQAVE